MELKNKLVALAETSRQGAKERRIETKIAHILEHLGWSDECIDQDVALSDKDRADIMLAANGITILFEVKQYGEDRKASAQVLRYCKLARPKPILAFLTDGVHWTVYYVGYDQIIPLVDAFVPASVSDIESTLNVLRPRRMKAIIEAGLFDYFDLIHRGIAASDLASQNMLLEHFANTVKSLLIIKDWDFGDEHQRPVEAGTSGSIDVIEQPATHVDEKPVYEQEVYSPFYPPSFTFTSIKAKFAGKHANSWADLVRIGVQVALATNLSVAQLQQMIESRIENGHRTDCGFKSVEGYDVCVQGMEAPQAWRDAFLLAQRLKCDIEVHFQYWKSDKVPAEHRGKSGVLRWSP